MKGKYIKPSELLKLQKETGKSYWDLIGRPLGKKPKDLAKDVVDEYDPVQREALRMQIESALDYPQYKGGKSPKVKTWNDNDIADLIIGFEGFLPHAKDIGDGKITIGSGLTNPKYTRFGTITPEQNRRFVLEEIAARKARLSRNVPGWNTLPGSAKAALLSYDYGWMVDRKTSPKMMKALQDRNWLEVSNQMNAGLNMKKFKKGLRKRRTQERNLFLSDLYRPAPLKPVQTVSPMPKAKVPFEVNQMEDKIAPIVNQQQPIVPYTSTVELPQEYTIPENDMASIDLENTSRIKPNDILQSYYNMFGYKRGKSFPFQFWNRAGNAMSLQKFEEGKNNTNLVKIVGNEQAPYEQPVRFDEDGNLITRDLTGNLHSNSILLPEVTVKGNAGYNLANHVDALTPWGLVNQYLTDAFSPIAQTSPTVGNTLSKMRYIAPSYWIDRINHSDDEIINGEGNIFGTGNGLLLDGLIGNKGLKSIKKPISNIGDINSSVIEKLYPIAENKKIQYSPKKSNISTIHYDDVVKKLYSKVDDYIKTATPDAQEYALSLNRSILFENILQEAIDKGYITDSKILQSAPININPTIIKKRLKSGTSGLTTSFRSLIELDPTQMRDDGTAFHELLHNYNIGNPTRSFLKNKEYNELIEALEDYNSHTLKQQRDILNRMSHIRKQYYNFDKFIQDKASQVLYPDASEYIQNPEELVVHSLTTGRKLGLKPFQPFPGTKRAMDIIKKARLENDWLYDVKAGSTDQVKNFWKLLTGNYLPSAVTGLYGTKLLNNQDSYNSGKNIGDGKITIGSGLTNPIQFWNKAGNTMQLQR